MAALRLPTEPTVSDGQTPWFLFSSCLDIAESWQSRHGAEPSLPGLPYSQAQAFWVSAANVWCAKYREQALRLRLLTGVHSPDIFRVHGGSGGGGGTFIGPDPSRYCALIGCENHVATPALY